ncbi:hypothetical protein AN642_03160 [Epulopiscium sp. SCG-B10WGA-EpuloA2]|nr:hypothetical protein AN642_03160 [Epulopiscium sp. SCG-B10WGA-EpuloA2]
MAITVVLTTNTCRANQPEHSIKLNSINYDYILPTSNIEYLTSEHITNLEPDSLRLARNEIFARHGYIFQSEELLSYFHTKSWYQPKINGIDFDMNILNPFEQYNIDLIKQFEEQYVEKLPKHTLIGYIYIENEDVIYIDPVELIELEDTQRITELELTLDNHLPNGYYFHNPVIEQFEHCITEDTIFNFTDFNMLFLSEAEKYTSRDYTTSFVSEFIAGSSYQHIPLGNDKNTIPVIIEIIGDKIISITENFTWTI